MDDFFEDDFYYDSDSSSISLKDEKNEEIVLDDQDNLNARLTNKQIETLRYMRHLLRENKSLKQRLEIVETELEKYEEYNILISRNVLPLRDQATSVLIERPLSQKSIREVESSNCFSERQDQNQSPNKLNKLSFSIINEIEKDEEAKIINQDKEELTELFLEPVSVLENKQANSISKIDKACQSDDIFNDKLKIRELMNANGQLKLDHEREIKELNLLIGDLRYKLKSSNETIQNLQKNLEITNGKYADLEKDKIKFVEEIKQLIPLKQKTDLLFAENEQLYLELKKRQADLEDSNSKFLELTKNLNESFRMIESQKSLISNLEFENEKHLREKHIECENRINELSLKCEILSDELNKKTLEVEKFNEVNREMEKQIERYKLDLKNFNFKEFVSMKRELNSLKQEKERHFANIVTMPSKESQQVLPPIKESKKNQFQFF